MVSGDTNDWADVFARERCPTDASWTNYGSGFPGTLGVPALTVSANPVLGQPLDLVVGNSSGARSVGVLFLGAQRASIPSAWSGDLLVVPAITSIFGLPPGGATWSGDLPADDTYCGVPVDLQAIELDPGAAKGVSFTAGLELLLGS